MCAMDQQHDGNLFLFSDKLCDEFLFCTIASIEKKNENKKKFISDYRAALMLLHLLDMLEAMVCCVMILFLLCYTMMVMLL